MFVIFEERPAPTYVQWDGSMRLSPVVEFELWDNRRRDQPVRLAAVDLERSGYSLDGEIQFAEELEACDWAIRVRFTRHELFVEDRTFAQLVLDGDFHVAADRLADYCPEAEALMRRCFPPQKPEPKEPACRHRNLNRETAYWCGPQGMTYECEDCGVWVFTETRTCARCSARWEAIVGLPEEHCGADTAPFPLDDVQELHAEAAEVEEFLPF